MAGIGVLVGMSGNRNVVELEAGAGHVMFLELFLVFDPLNSEEGGDEHQGREQVANQQLATRGMCCPDGEHYGQAAADQNRSVGSAQRDVAPLPVRATVCEIRASVHQLTTHQT